MIRNVALLLVFVLVTGTGRQLVCGLDCRETRAAQRAICHDDQRSLSDGSIRADSRHVCDHDAEQSGLVTAKESSSLQARLESVSRAAVSTPPLTPIGVDALILARPPGIATRALSPFQTILRI